TPEVHPFPIERAGQDVGRGCILVSIGGKNIMLDCGMHMGFNDVSSCMILNVTVPLCNSDNLLVLMMFHYCAIVIFPETIPRFLHNTRTA
uniref:Uncharacterized protein n=1 Tax=Oncorhynchus kisutch TaxID=8019 RepID=A0A8C7FTD4_ONCKI